MAGNIEIKTDVLIIGGGLAGLMAALSAVRYTDKVTVVSKGPAGRSGNTLVSGGGIASATHEAGNDAGQFLTDLNKSAKQLNNSRLSTKLALESAQMLAVLESCGVGLVRQNGGYKRRQPPGHSVPRNIPTDWTGLSYLNRGLSFTLPLLKRAQEQNICLCEKVKIIKLLKTGSRISGAVGIDREGKRCSIRAGSVVLTAGGGGYIYGRTNNTRDITGDGLALALDAGCELQDMEQVQFYPTMMFQPLKVPVSNPLFGAGAVLRNRDGEAFMERYDANGNMATRDSMARAIFLEAQAGKGVGDSVYFDCTQIPAERLRELFKDFYQFLSAQGIDPAREYLLVSPCVHYFLGGIRIDDHCRTGVAGLYAAGEICGGIHGANRLSGAALMEACVFGWQAGATAAQEVQQLPDSSYDPAPCPGIVPVDQPADLKELRDMMWKNASLVRDEQGLKQTLSYLEECKNRWLSAASWQDTEMKAMTTVAEAVVRSALLRRESRGAHYRRDFPGADDRYKGNIICRQAGNELKVSFEQLETK